MSKRWILGGTTEGRLLAEFCGQKGIPVIVTVATEYGSRLVEAGGSVETAVGAMDAPEMAAFIKRHGITEAIDATHPYALEVTANVKRACEETGISYLRCLRECGETNLRGNPDVKIVRVGSAEEAVRFLAGKSGAVLLLTGSKTLDVYTELPDYRNRIYARILPEEKQIARCRDLGIEGSHLICMQGPFSEEMNVATIRQTKAQYLVTKESGSAGGFEEKLAAAAVCKITAVVIGRRQEETGLSLEEIKRHLCPKKQTVFLVGIGMGSAEILTQEGVRAIESCGLLMGAERMVNAVRHLAPGAKTAVGYMPRDILREMEAYEGTAPAAAVFSGDTGFQSGAPAVKKALEEAGYPVRMLPGISSLSYLAARLGCGWEDAYVVSLHGREADEAEPLLKGHRKLFYLLDGRRRAEQVLKALTSRGYGGLRAAVGENLSYAEEILTEGTVAELAEGEYGALAVMIVYEEEKR